MLLFLSFLCVFFLSSRQAFLKVWEMGSERDFNTTISAKLHMIGLSETSVIEIAHASQLKPSQNVFLLSNGIVCQFPPRLVIVTKVQWMYFATNKESQHFNGKSTHSIISKL